MKTTGEIMDDYSYDDFGSETTIEYVSPGFSENRANINAINTYVETTLRNRVLGLKDAKKISESDYKKWLVMREKWTKWFSEIEKSWYISDSDIAYARKQRQDMNMLIEPIATKKVSETARDIKPAYTPEDAPMSPTTKLAIITVAGTVLGALVLYKLAPIAISAIPAVAALKKGF